MFYTSELNSKAVILLKHVAGRIYRTDETAEDNKIIRFLFVFKTTWVPSN